MKIFNDRFDSSLAGLGVAMQSSMAGAASVEYNLEFIANDVISFGESFDSNVFLDIASGTELTTFEINLLTCFSHLNFNGFTNPAWIGRGFLNDASGLADPFGRDDRIMQKPELATFVLFLIVMCGAAMTCKHRLIQFQISNLVFQTKVNRLFGL